MFANIVGRLLPWGTMHVLSAVLSGGDSCALNFAGHPQVNRDNIKPSSGKQAELWRSSVF